MYHFKIKKEEGGEFRFELGGINMLVDNYLIKENQHFLSNPGKVIAYFNVDDNLFSVSNDPLNFETAEAFYDEICKQYKIFTKRMF